MRSRKRRWDAKTPISSRRLSDEVLAWEFRSGERVKYRLVTPEVNSPNGVLHAPKDVKGMLYN